MVKAFRMGCRRRGCHGCLWRLQRLTAGAGDYCVPRGRSGGGSSGSGAIEPYAGAPCPSLSRLQSATIQWRSASYHRRWRGERAGVGTMQRYGDSAVRLCVCGGGAFRYGRIISVRPALCSVRRREIPAFPWHGGLRRWSWSAVVAFGRRPQGGHSPDLDVRLGRRPGVIGRVLQERRRDGAFARARNSQLGSRSSVLGPALRLACARRLPATFQWASTSRAYTSAA